MKNKNIIFEDELKNNKSSKLPMFDENDYVCENELEPMDNPFMDFGNSDNRNLYTIEDYGLVYKSKKIYVGSIIRNHVLSTNKKIKIFVSYLKKQKKDFVRQIKGIEKRSNNATEYLNGLKYSKFNIKEFIIALILIIFNAFMLSILKINNLKNEWILRISRSILEKSNSLMWFKVVIIFSVVSIALYLLCSLVYLFVINKHKKEANSYQEQFNKNIKIVKKCFYKEYKNIKSYYINKIKRKEIYYEALSLDRIWNNNISFRDFDDSKSNFENDIIKLKKFIRIFKIIKILLLSIAIITNMILFINVIIYGLTNI